MKPPQYATGIVSAILSLVLLFPASIAAHDLYIFPAAFSPKPGSVARVGMHNGDAFPDSETPPVFERVRDASVLSAEGGAPLRRLREEGNAGAAEYTVPEGSHILAMRTVPHFLLLDPTQFEGYLNHENLNWVIRWRVDNMEFAKEGREFYSKYAKALVNLEHDDHALKPIGHEAEIVLLGNPARAPLGSAIPVQVLFRGRPAKSQPIQMAWAHRGKTETRWVGNTDTDGKILLKIESPGTWKLHTVIIERCSRSEEADWESFWASLTFAVPESR